MRALELCTTSNRSSIRLLLREMIQHENDGTNHRIRGLLIVQGLCANAQVGAVRESEAIRLILRPVGILVTLSAFAVLYKSYRPEGICSAWATKPSTALYGRSPCHWNRMYSCPVF
jgi:hypothetical protein